MTTLKHQLDQLAEDAPDGSTSHAHEGDLWRRGKRLRRRQGAVTGSFVAALVIETLSRLDALCEGPVHLSPDGQRVVTTADVNGAGGSTGRPGPMVVADVTGPHEGVIRVLDEKPDARVIGWAV